MIQRALRQLYAAGTRRFIINTHHCPEVWEKAFPDHRFQDATIEFVFEPELLDTGGGLANIASKLTESDQDLVIWNGDILSTCPLTKAYDYHQANGAEVTLVVREQGPNCNVRIADDGRVTDLRHRLGSADPCYQYTGICIVSKKFAQSLPTNRDSLIEYFLRQVTTAPDTIQGFLDSSKQWHDLGTIEEYQAVKAELEKPVRGAISPQEAASQHGYRLDPTQQILKGGSGRQFFRVFNHAEQSAILCLYNDTRPENLLYGTLAQALKNQAKVNVPTVYGEDTDRGILILEDLGTTDLWTLAQAPQFPWESFASAIEQVTRLHREGTAATQGITLMEAFSPKLYQWERDYFKDNILAGQAYDRGVHQEMESLAKELLAQPAVTVHRDFQSQNILVKNQEAWLIDFQGLRTGCAFYDFASLAFDPYLTRPDMDLWRIEIEDHARETSEWAGSRDEFTHLLHVAATQRLLQACGAYGFLGKKQNLPQYLAHLPQGLKNLRVAASLTGRRKLSQLAEDLAAKLTSR
jgi:aminoglycoside/choline kinase family phosphotransferase/choline kinase